MEETIKTNKLNIFCIIDLVDFNPLKDKESPIISLKDIFQVSTSLHISSSVKLC